MVNQYYQKQKKIENIRNLYLAHKTLGFYKVFWKLKIPKTNFNT